MMNVGNNSDTANAYYGASPDGSTVVDDTARINAFLSLATPTQPVKLIMDGIAAITGIVISPAGNTCIEGLGRGTGFFQLGDSNMDGIRIGPYAAIAADQGDSEGVASNRANTPARTAQNIVLRDFTMGGQGNTLWAAPAGVSPGITTPPDKPVVGDPFHQTYGVLLVNCQNVLVDNVHVYNSTSFSLCLGNIGPLQRQWLYLRHDRNLPRRHPPERPCRGRFDQQLSRIFW